MGPVILYWSGRVLYTSAGQAWDRDISLSESAILAGALTDEGPHHVAVRLGRP